MAKVLKLLLAFSFSLVLYIPIIVSADEGSSWGEQIKMDTSYSTNKYGYMDIYLNRNEEIKMQYIMSVQNGTVPLFSKSIQTTTQSGENYLQFSKLPVITSNNQDNFKLLYSTDNINFSDEKPDMKDLVAFRVLNTKNINNETEPLTVDFSMVPLKISEKELNQRIFAFGSYKTLYSGTNIIEDPSWDYPVNSYLLICMLSISKLY